MSESKPKKPIFKRWWFWVLVVVVVVIIVNAVSGNKGGDTTATSGSSTSTTDTAAPVAPATSAPEQDDNATRTVEYVVEGSGKATSITYLTVDNGQSSQSQAMDAALPWSKTIEVSQKTWLSGTSFTLTAQAGAAGGDIHAIIKVDGKVVAENTSSGAYAVVTANATGK